MRTKLYLTLSERIRERNPLIQVLLGPRQVGKTTMAKAIFDEWAGPKFMVSADLPSPPTPDWVRFSWEKARQRGDGTLLIIDEIQKIPSWSEQVKILFDEDRGKRDLRVVFLGSSSLYLQKGLTESLSGRFELIEAPHWSYEEFHSVFGWNFETYFRFGAYPGATGFIQDKSRWRKYILDSIIEPVLGRDILGLHPVQKPALFRQTFELAMQHPAKIISLQKMLGQLQDRGNATTIQHYLLLLEKSFLIRALQKYSGTPIQTKASSPKIVVLNPALIHAYQSENRLDEDPLWYGHVFESVVGAHLASIPNSELFYWREGNDEVDYVLKTSRGLFAFEIKSGIKLAKGRGVLPFSKKYPKAHCEIWGYEEVVKTLKNFSSFTEKFL
ncbi:MAG: ATP-binding protein [Chlamydiae bacterium]|nr:ATP-binding protein [Chlamydiota bacterium]MBI3266234.1 ATP-binding protein [Chlamydiota bacterium]